MGFGVPNALEIAEKDTRCGSSVIRRLASCANSSSSSLWVSHHSEESANNFPPLPVRPEHVLVWVASFADDAAYARYRERSASDPRWARDIAPALMQRLIWPADVHRLRPAARSLLQD